LLQISKKEAGPKTQVDAAKKAGDDVKRQLTNAADAAAKKAKRNRKRQVKN